MDVDKALDDIGTCGVWHLWVFFWILWAVVWQGAVNVAIVFMQQIPEFVCRTALTTNSSWTFDQLRTFTSPITDGEPQSCKIYDLNYTQFASIENYTEALHIRNALLNSTSVNVLNCDVNNVIWRFEGMEKTIVTQWKLICNDAIQVSNTQLSFTIGFLTGCLVAGFLSDRFAGGLGGVLAMIDPVIPNFYGFVVVRFLMGLCVNCSLMTLYVLALELANDKMRKILGAIYFIAWSLGYVALAGIAYLTKNWITMHLICAAPTLVTFLFYWILPESPRWLVSQGRVKEAKRLIKWAAKWNGKEISLSKSLTDMETIKINQRDDQDQQTAEGHSESQEDSQNFLVVFKSARLTLRTLNIFFNWVVNAFVYYGISLLVTSFSGDVFENNAISGAVEIPGYLLCYPCLLWARKKSLFLLLLIAGVSCLVYTAVPENVVWAQLLVAFTGKLCVTASFNLVYVVTLELYPTQIRGGAVALSSMIGRLGSIAAPYVTLIAQKNPALTAVPMVIFGIAALAAAALTIFIPESQNQPLPDTIEEAIDYPPKRRNPDSGKMLRNDYGMWSAFERCTT